jgi:hypothetical protein
MKWTSVILFTIMVMLVLGLFASNIVLKAQYKQLDKNDTYWTYGKILEKPFKYLKLDGGNLTNIAFEQSPAYSVRVLHDWQRVRENPISARVNNDTLYIKFTYKSEDQGETNWMRRLTLVRIFSPEILSVEGFNTNFEMFKLKQKSISVNMSGKSRFEVESFIPDLDSLNVVQRDSSEVVFEMSPEYAGPKSGVMENKALQALATPPSQQVSNEAMTIKSLNANLKGHTILDVGHAQIQGLKLNITDTSAIILSGAALRKFCKEGL